MRRKFFVLPLFAALLLIAALGTGMTCISATATQVTDGNSFDATASSAHGWANASCHRPGDQGNTYHVQLTGIAAPTGDQCYAQEATDYLKGLIEGKRVCLLPDMGIGDPNQQLFAYVAVSSDQSTMRCDVFVNADMVMKGYARADTVAHPSLLNPFFQFLECQAYSQGLGMWGACPDLTPPAGCGVQPTPTPAPNQTATPAPEQTVTPTPTESAGTPTPTSSQNCCRPCIPGPFHRCEQQRDCNCSHR